MGEDRLLVSGPALQVPPSAGPVTAALGWLRNLVRPMWLTSAFAPPTPPPDRGGLTVVSYNVLLGGQRLAQAHRDLVRLDADVICLQETSRAATEALARSLGMHVAFYGDPSPLGGSLKAVLSRYPIEGARHQRYDVPLAQRLAKVWELAKAGKWGMLVEPLESRSVLQATIKVGDRRIDVLDTHLGLQDTAANAAQLDQLATMVGGRSVVLAGDFNANWALAPRPGAAPDQPGRFDTPTDTPAEYAARYGKAIGNMADPRVQQAAARLLGQLRSHWDAPERSAIVESTPITPEQARAELGAGTVPAGSPRHKQLLAAMDGVTHLPAGKRFDGVFASPDLRMARSLVDQSATGSDHQPVLAEVRWD